MANHAIDFQGIVSLDRSLVDLLQDYLEERESFLSQMIAQSIPLQAEYWAANPPFPNDRQKLSEGVETFARKATQAIGNSQSLSPSDWQSSAGTINAAIWDYVELLEGNVVELFQQLDQVGLESWRPELVKVVESIKDILSHNMEDLKWAMKRLESQLWDLRAACEKKSIDSYKIWRSLGFYKSILDSSILKNIEKSQKFLNFNYQKFLQKFAQFDAIKKKSEQSIIKFAGYEVFNSLETSLQEEFKKVYSLLKMRLYNLQSKSVSDSSLINILRRTTAPDKACVLFKSYFKALQNKLFEQSRTLKQEEDILTDPVKKKELQGALAVQRLEIHTLGATIARYREFILKSDPNPYVRTRGGFSEWIVGLEPPQSKSLLDQGYDTEALDNLYHKFNESLKSEKDKIEILELHQEIQQNLHDMAQPLASSSMMRLRDEQFVKQLQQLDELASSDPSIVDFITQILSRAMRADWKYHLLNDNPLFHQLYAVHIGILGPLEDRNHLNRMNKFKRLTQQLLQWVKDKQLFKHFDEIELDSNDIKGYLQDFFGQLQRVAKDPALFSKENGAQVIEEFSQQLLEYRYLFSNFFHNLREEQSDEKLMRHQFLFVDQYFESIENKLTEMKNVDLEN